MFKQWDPCSVWTLLCFKTYQYMTLLDLMLAPWNIKHISKLPKINLAESQIIWAIAWQNQQNDLCTQRRLWSSWESSLSAWRKAGSSSIHKEHSKDWSDWADAQADLSLCWVHMSFCWFCHTQAQMLNSLGFDWLDMHKFIHKSTFDFAFVRNTIIALYSQDAG